MGAQVHTVQVLHESGRVGVGLQVGVAQLALGKVQRLRGASVVSATWEWAGSASERVPVALLAPHRTPWR